MRVTSELFVSALVRRVFASGGFAAVERKGSAEAGAIFVRQLARDGSETLYGPAPQSFFEEGQSDDRRFECRLSGQDRFAIADVIAREARFDPDLWVVELEIDAIDGFIEIATE